MLIQKSCTSRQLPIISNTPIVCSEICVSKHLAYSILFDIICWVCVSECVCVCKWNGYNLLKQLPVANANTSNTQLLIINSFLLLEPIRNGLPKKIIKPQLQQQQQKYSTEKRTICSLHSGFTVVVKSQTNSSFTLPQSHLRNRNLYYAQNLWNLEIHSYTMFEGDDHTNVIKAMVLFRIIEYLKS